MQGRISRTAQGYQTTTTRPPASSFGFDHIPSSYNDPPKQNRPEVVPKKSQPNDSDDDIFEISLVKDNSGAKGKGKGKEKDTSTFDSASSAMNHKSGKYSGFKIKKKSQQNGTPTNGDDSEVVERMASQNTKTPKLSTAESAKESTRSARTQPRQRSPSIIDVDDNDSESSRPKPSKKPSQSRKASTKTRTSPPPEPLVPKKSVRRIKKLAYSEEDESDADLEVESGSNLKEEPKKRKPKAPAAFPMLGEMSTTAPAPAPRKKQLKQPADFPMDIGSSRTTSRKESPVLDISLTPPKAQSKAQPFPMTPPSPGGPPSSAPVSGSGKKRPSLTESSDSDDEPADVRQKNGASSRNTKIMRREATGESLCPFCDTPLPARPTNTLKLLLEHTTSQARRDPRPGNPDGLKASLTVYAVFCQRHQFETSILPQAEAKGWPKSIDWDAMAERIIQMEPELKEVIDRGSDQPSSSIFWRELAVAVRNKGSLVVGGLGEQFATFQKTQPGYYGEQGSMVIHQSLYNIFPLASFDISKIAPLTPTHFVEKVLVPEVALRLILQDQGTHHSMTDENVQTALATLRESASYGTAMFPVDGADWDLEATSTTEKNRKGKQRNMAINATGAGDMTSAADKMVAERAKLRRREIEEADGEAGVVEGFRVEDKRPKPRPRKKRGAVGMTDEEMSEAGEMDTGGFEAKVDSATIRPRPRAKARKRAQTSDSEVGGDAMELDSPPPMGHRTLRATSSQSSVYECDKMTSSLVIEDDDDEDIVASSPAPIVKKKQIAPFPMDFGASSSNLDATPKASKTAPKKKDKGPRGSQRQGKSDDVWRTSYTAEASEDDSDGVREKTFIMDTVPRPPKESYRPKKIVKEDSQDFDWMYSSDGEDKPKKVATYTH